MMKILIVQHSWDSPPGLLAERIMARDWKSDIFHPTAAYAAFSPLTPAELPTHHAGYNGMAILGGPMDAVDDANYPHYQTLFALIDSFADAEKPVIGLCLGAQLIARHYGAEVRRLEQMEIGLTEIELWTGEHSDRLLDGADRRAWLMEWHRDFFDLPTGAVLLATGSECRHQIFRMGKSVYASQGHLEATLDTVRRWIFNGRTGLPSERVQDLPRIVGEIDQHWMMARSFAQRVLDRWLDLIEVPSE